MYYELQLGVALVAFRARLGEKFGDSKMREDKVLEPKIKQTNKKSKNNIALAEK